MNSWKLPWKLPWTSTEKTKVQETARADVRQAHELRSEKNTCMMLKGASPWAKAKTAKDHVRVNEKKRRNDDRKKWTRWAQPSLAKSARYSYKYMHPPTGDCTDQPTTMFHKPDRSRSGSDLVYWWSLCWLPFWDDVPESWHTDHTDITRKNIICARYVAGHTNQEIYLPHHKVFSSSCILFMCVRGFLRCLWLKFALH